MGIKILMESGAEWTEVAKKMVERIEEAGNVMILGQSQSEYPSGVAGFSQKTMLVTVEDRPQRKKGS